MAPQVTAKPGFVNGPLLNAAGWGAMVKNLDPSQHRLKNAFGLSIGLMIGRQMMNLLTGETPGGEKIDADDIPTPLRPLCGVLSYNHFSDDPKDRWMKVYDNFLPALVGAGGAIWGSYDFAMEQAPYAAANAAMKDASKLTIDSAETLSKFTQSHPWRGLSGLTAMFGSSSGFGLVPGLHNYGSTLGSSFIGIVPRDKLSTPYFPGLQKFMSGNKHYYAFGPASMLPRMRDYLVHNPDKNPKQARDMAYAIMEQWFGDKVTEKHIDAFVKEVHAVRDKFLSSGGVPENLKEQCGKELTGVMTGLGLEKTFRKIGLNPEEAVIGRNGFIEFMSRMLGYGNRLDTIDANFKKATLARAGKQMETLPINAITREITHPHDMKLLFTGGALVAAGATMIGAMAMNARKWHQEDNEELLACKRDALSTVLAKSGSAEESEKEKATTAALENAVNKVETIAEKTGDDTTATRAAIADRFLYQKDKLAQNNGKKAARWIDDKPLKFLEWTSDGLNSPETVGLHRLSCAIGLTGGGVVGMKIAEALTGRHISGAAVGIDKVPEFLRPIYKKLAFNPHSDNPKDRWGFVLNLAIPSVFATAGIISASSLFFRGRKAKVGKAEFIDDYEDKATMAQAQPWTLLTATSSLLATPSGNPFLPIPGVNYGMSLGTRFMLSSGRKVIFPGLGEFWSGNASRYPLGPSGLRDYMIKYAIGNTSPHPEQLEEMAIGILKPWFKDITGEQILAFVHKVEEDRDRFLKQGGIPEEAKKACEKELIKHFKGAGLEATLREIGLDPLKASLGNNGASATVAKWLGAQGTLDDIFKEYADKYAGRNKPYVPEIKPLVGSNTTRLACERAQKKAASEAGVFLTN